MQVSAATRYRTVSVPLKWNGKAIGTAILDVEYEYNSSTKKGTIDSVAPQEYILTKGDYVEDDGIYEEIYVAEENWDSSTGYSVINIYTYCLDLNNKDVNKYTDNQFTFSVTSTGEVTYGTPKYTTYTNK